MHAPHSGKILKTQPSLVITIKTTALGQAQEQRSTMQIQQCVETGDSNEEKQTVVAEFAANQSAVLAVDEIVNEIYTLSEQSCTQDVW